MNPSNRMTDLARRALAHLQAGTTDQAPEILDLPVSTYLDPDRYRHEHDLLFMHRPLALALSVELPEPGSYLARTILGKPLLFTRSLNGEVNIFLNVCRHRGARVCDEGKGKAGRFNCPYHAWTYNREGKLVGMSGKKSFGDLDADSHGLTRLASAEHAGLIWGLLTPGEAFDIADWLGDFAEELETLNLANWHLFDQRLIPGGGWKATMDGYLEAYHHDTVHTYTLSPHTIGNLLVHDVFGRHQRLTMGRRNLGELAGKPESEWNSAEHIRLIHNIFPNVSIAGVLGDHCLVSQMLPGSSLGETITIQSVLSARKPETPEELARSAAYSEMSRVAVGLEDYPICLSIQAGLASGANTAFAIGRNEPGIQHWHRMVAEEAGWNGASAPTKAKADDAI